jgi:hypothetical protein
MEEFPELSEERMKRRKKKGNPKERGSAVGCE